MGADASFEPCQTFTRSTQKGTCMSTAIVIGPDVIPVRPDADHEYVIDTAAVAKGYGVTSEMVRQHKARHAEELTEGKHWVSVTNSNAQPGKGAQSQTLWTKRGVVRLGFFIRSKRAKISATSPRTWSFGPRRPSRRCHTPRPFAASPMRSSVATRPPTR